MRTLTPLGDARSKSNNTVFVRDIPLAERLLKSSPPLKVGRVWL